MRRAELEERDIERLADLAGEAGVSFRVEVDRTGAASVVIGSLGAFDDVQSAERALHDVARVPA